MELNISKDKQEVFIKSTMWNSIIEVFKIEKNIDITDYLVSIKIKSNNVFIKVNRNIIINEALLLDDKIKEQFEIKLKKIGITFSNYNLKYI